MSADFWRAGARSLEGAYFCTHKDADGEYDCEEEIPHGEMAFFPGEGGAVECMKHRQACPTCGCVGGCRSGAV